MQKASNAYKQAMLQKVRDRAHISVGIGVVNQEAQHDAVFSGDYTAWSNKQQPFSGRQIECEYATMEQGFLRADGSQQLLPDEGFDQYLTTGVVTAGLCPGDNLLQGTDELGTWTVTGDGSWKALSVLTDIDAQYSPLTGSAMAVSFDIKADDLQTAPDNYLCVMAILGANAENSEVWERINHYEIGYLSDFNVNDYQNNAWVRVSTAFANLCGWIDVSARAYKKYRYAMQIFTKSTGSVAIRRPKLEFGSEASAYRPAGAGLQYQSGVAVRVDFGNQYNIKGLTVDFSDNYPTAFVITTAEKTLTYTNNKRVFTTTDVLGETDHIIISPLAMVGGQQRLRIYGIMMGVGLSYGDADVGSATISEYVSGISAELPGLTFSLSVLDYSGNYDVDDENSFINFLETRQPVTLSYGMTLADGSVEWIPTATAYLSDWSAKKGQMQFTAKDIFSFLEDEYSAGNKIYTRTAYTEAVSILTDAGFEADEYEIDECLKDVTLTNPMPVAKHNECLQLICNACRCILYQNVDGKIIIQANFANVIEPEDIEVAATSAAAWSAPRNVLTGASVVYADMSSGFMMADGTQFMMPTDGSYSGETGYVTSTVADAAGLFSSNPKLTLGLPAGYIYFGVYIDFDGQPPKELIIHTFRNGAAQENITFNNLETHNLLSHEFAVFDVMQFEFTKAMPHARVLVNKITFGDMADYVLSRDLMISEPVGYKDKRVKDVYVRICTFENDKDGNPKQIDDDIWYKKSINPTGENKYCENQLVSTEEHAQQLAEWLGNYYANNVTYTVDHRGEPRLHAADLLYMESEVLSNLQVEVESTKLNYNGGFSGSLELRRALKGGNEQ